MTVYVIKIKNRESWYLRISYRACDYRLSSRTGDKIVAHDIAQQIERLMTCQQRRQKPDPELLEWTIHILHPRIRTKLIEFGILDAQASEAMRPIADIIEQWKLSILERKRGNHHARQSAHRIIILCAAAGIDNILQITPEAIEFALGAINKGTIDKAIIDAIEPPLREQDKKRLREGLSPQTCNHYLVSARSFCNWLKAPARKLLTHNPLDGVTGFDHKAIATHRKYRRRALEPHEQTLLLTYVKGTAKHLFGMTGEHRWLVYSLEILTGLRDKELCGLRARDFHLDEGLILLPAALSKARREEELPLHSSLIEPLQKHLAAREGDQIAFDLPHPDTLVDMARRDYVDAGIKIDVKTGRDASGFVLDFYSLRHSFGTNLGRLDISANIHAQLMRHKDPKTTRKYYTHLKLADGQNALEKLQPPTVVPCQADGASILKETIPSRTRMTPTGERTLQNAIAIMLRATQALAQIAN